MIRTGNWTSEFYPYPYNFLFQGTPAPQQAPLLPIVPPGLGDCGCGCNGKPGGCGGGEKSGLGFFETPFDLDSWGIAEYAAAAAALYFVGSIIGDTNRGIERTRRYGRVVKTGFKAGYRAGRGL